ncbi:MAG: cell division ATP-binding protein FtsE [Peptoniphilus sp. oral taxon 375]|uniref:cell division ATP-binding protein FtsE n=1 Tax=Urinicoccus timonensis TaxID=2024205 RepID=UPI00021A1A03|nr:cell division ATP-binding protein FtsE [Urinicoccus timonensis]EGS30901.1 cell division ATP-binding protein FtsE [Peptoniphilus sp. oral taxon 375 str. F0436]MBS4871751.1 cell division ATP-binding protein FtsE [Peptoniphilus sp. oral taxon 375]
MIIFNHVYKEYKNGVMALNDVSLEIPSGDFVFLVGASGAGKSTMIKLLIREEQVSKGFIRINDTDISAMPKYKIPKLRREVGVVFQDYRLLDRKTVFENIAYALEITGESSSEIKKRVESVLETVHLEDKQNCYPTELSGGESQRVSIARAMIHRPKILVCDEPTGNLDFDTAKDIMDALDRFNQEGVTIVMATHAREIVDAMKKRVVSLENGSILFDQESAGYYENPQTI